MAAVSTWKSSGAVVLPSPTGPCAVAVNPVVNKIYLAHGGAAIVTVIDGSTEATTVVVGTNPRRLGVNPTANKIYVPNLSGGNVTVIDGATKLDRGGAGNKPFAEAVNLLTNKICGQPGRLRQRRHRDGN